MASCWMSISIPCKGIWLSIAAFTGAVSARPVWQKKGNGIQKLWIGGCDRRSCCFLDKAPFIFGETPRGLRAWEPILGVKRSCVNCAELAKTHLGLDVVQSNMSAATLVSRFSTLEVSEKTDVQRGEAGESSVGAIRHDSSNRINAEVEKVDPTGVRRNSCMKRQVCKRCGKAASLCICHHIKTVVKNKTAITILQHPREKNHHLGSARIALLALQNVELISIPEVDEQVSHRMRGKVPGSKRFIAGRGGKKAHKLEEGSKKTRLPSNCSCGPPKLQPPEPNYRCEPDLSRESSNSARGDGTLLEFDATLGVEDAARTSTEDRLLVQWNTVPPWIKLRPDAGLLFPSEHALDLWPVGLALVAGSDDLLTFQCDPGSAAEEGVPSNSPSQLIVLDGTWSKAKRIFFENPWLRSLPHYQLPTLQHSRYGRLRREPKPGFLSTVESIVYALQLLEPETPDLESLLDVFERMIEDQMKFVTHNKLMENVKHGQRSWRGST